MLEDTKGVNRKKDTQFVCYSKTNDFWLQPWYLQTVLAIYNKSSQWFYCHLGTDCPFGAPEYSRYSVGFELIWPTLEHRHTVIVWSFTKHEPNEDQEINAGAKYYSRIYWTCLFEGFDLFLFYHCIVCLSSYWPFGIFKHSRYLQINMFSKFGNNT
jgi:hypothetical protein